MISVIVPAYNAEATIGDCVRALQHQSLSSDKYEIIVVDDGSTDATLNIARQLGVMVKSQPRQYAAAARNTGAAAACGNLLLFTDADCAANSDWIAVISAPFANSDVVGVKGTYRTRQRELIARFVQLEYEDKYDRMSKELQIDFIDTYSAAYRRDIFLLNGGFDSRLRAAEDKEFSFRLAHKGYRLVFVPSAIVYHHHNTTLRAYFRRKFDFGYWNAILTAWYPDKAIRDSHTRQVAKFQIGLVGCILASLPLFFLSWNTVWLEAGLILLFALSTLPFAVKAGRKDWQIGSLAPLLLFVRAAAQGMGLLAGFLGHSRSLSASQKVLSARQMMVKRGLDISIGIVAIACCLPIWAVIAVLIKLDSRGPVFFVQRRVGENGRVFNCYRFRTMVGGAETLSTNILRKDAIGGATLKLPEDPRHTRVGRVLRRTSLDETPTLINVLRGEMSLVGPRPEEVPVVDLYSDWHRKRLVAKPGITGPMQVSGRGTLTLDERVRLELDYIEHYSLRRDIEILLRTIPVVIKGRGAY
jgi:lipopolysaccharide/colanic/teichoic acid biosynthesis glycosyltransferase/glycosyltransferase involved in cell wall biosynthesis